MICPRTKAECDCSAMNFPICQPPPTLSEIERRLDQFEAAATSLDLIGENETYRIKASATRQEAKAALMAAIRAYGRE